MDLYRLSGLLSREDSRDRSLVARSGRWNWRDPAL